MTEVHLVVVAVRFDVPTDAVDPLASAFMADDRTATVWIEAGGKTSRLAFDIEAGSFEEARAVAEVLVTDTAAAHATSVEIISVGRPASADRLT